VTSVFNFFTSNTYISIIEIRLCPYKYEEYVNAKKNYIEKLTTYVFVCVRYTPRNCKQKH